MYYSPRVLGTLPTCNRFEKIDGKYLIVIRFIDRLEVFLVNISYVDGGTIK